MCYKLITHTLYIKYRYLTILLRLCIIMCICKILKHFVVHDSRQWQLPNNRDWIQRSPYHRKTMKITSRLVREICKLTHTYTKLNQRRVLQLWCHIICLSYYGNYSNAIYGKHPGIVKTTTATIIIVIIIKVINTCITESVQSFKRSPLPSPNTLHQFALRRHKIIKTPDLTYSVNLLTY